jgi:hypothetical protein
VIRPAPSGEDFGDSEKWVDAPTFFVSDFVSSGSGRAVLPRVPVAKDYISLVQLIYGIIGHIIAEE